MRVAGLLAWRVRGFRVVDVAAFVLVLALALSVYAFKTFAGAERANIADVESDIRDESRHVRLLKAEIAHLESPERLARLARGYAGQSPVTAKQEISPEALPQAATQALAPAPIPPAAANSASAPQ